jgi:predicted ABC-type ATPase
VLSPHPVLHLLAGPNGAGKTTLVTKVLQPQTHLPFVNADVIAAREWPGHEESHGYDASRAAALERTAFLEARRSFISETVFSHPSKLALIRQALVAGFQVELHVVLVPEDLAVARVAYRAQTGGHQVPEAKIRERYRRVWPLVVRAREQTDCTWVYDNSLAAAPLRLVAQYERGVLLGPSSYPSWAPEVLLG